MHNSSIELDLLRTFVAIAARESFALAAEQVHLTQSAVTQQMQRLEAQLGAPLFRKIGRSKKLTDQGMQLLEHAHRMLAMNDELFESFAGANLRGPLRIGSAYDAAEFILPNLLARFSQLYPNVQIDVHTARSAHLMQALKRGEIEITIVGTPDATADPAHPSVRLRSSPLVWMCAVNYVHDASKPLPLVVPEEPSSYRRAAIACLDAHGIPWRIRHVSTSVAFTGLWAAVRAGLGIAVRTMEMLTPDLRVLGEAEGLPRLSEVSFFLYLRHERTSLLARRLFASVSEGRLRPTGRRGASRAKRRIR